MLLSTRYDRVGFKTKEATGANKTTNTRARMYLVNMKVTSFFIAVLLYLGAAQDYKVYNKICLGKRGQKGERDTHFTVFDINDLDDCKVKCNPNDNCPGFQFGNGKCKVWKKPINENKTNKGNKSSTQKCYIKKFRKRDLGEEPNKDNGKDKNKNTDKKNLRG